MEERKRDEELLRNEAEGTEGRPETPHAEQGGYSTSAPQEEHSLAHSESAKLGHSGGEVEDKSKESVVEPPAQTPTEEKPAETPAEKPAEAPSQSYQSYMEGWKKENPIESEEEYRKRRKRMQNAALLGAVSDGISSISNLYYTTQYAPSAKTPNMSGKVLYRYNQMEKERNANKKAWAEGAMRARQLDDAKEKEDRNWRRQLERDAKQDEKDANAERRAQEKHDWEKDLQEPKKRLAEAQAGTAEQKLKNLPQEQADKHAQSVASTAAANRSHRSGGGEDKSKKYPVYHKDGTTTYASSEEEWESQIVAETEPQERNRVYMRDGKGNIYADKKTLTRLNGRHLQIGKKRMRSRSYKK